MPPTEVSGSTRTAAARSFEAGGAAGVAGVGGVCGASHRVVQIMARHGLRWTYGNGDTQHFDAAPGTARTSARAYTTWMDTFVECDGACD